MFTYRRAWRDISKGWRTELTWLFLNKNELMKNYILADHTKKHPF
ncbi:hypothetical protein GCM10026983_27600 [Gracilibacillus alcaliphilus]